MVSAAYSSYTDQQLTIKAERRVAYAAFIEDFESCVRPETSLLDRVIEDGLKRGTVPTVEQLRGGFTGDVIGWQVRMQTSAARVVLLSDSSEVSRAATDAATAAADFRERMYDRTLADRIEDLAAINASTTRALDDTGNRSRAAVERFKDRAKDEVGVTDSFGDALSAPGLYKFAAFALLALAVLAFYRVFRLSPNASRSPD